MEKNVLFSLYNIRWSLFFNDKFGSQSSLQISLFVAVGKKKNQYSSENDVLISVLKYKASASYTSCQKKRETIKELLTSKAEIQSISWKNHWDTYFKNLLALRSSFVN